MFYTYRWFLPAWKAYLIFASFSFVACHSSLLMVQTAGRKAANEKNPVKERVIADKTKSGTETIREQSRGAGVKPANEEATEKQPKERPYFQEAREEYIQLDLERYRNIHGMLESKKYDTARLSMDAFLQRQNEALSEPGYVIYLQNAYFYLQQKNPSEYKKAIDLIDRINQRFPDFATRYGGLLLWNHAIQERREDVTAEEDFIHSLEASIASFRKERWQGTFLYLNAHRMLVKRYQTAKSPEYKKEKKRMELRFHLLGISYVAYAKKHSDKMEFLAPVYLEKDKLGLTLLEKKRIKTVTEQYKYSYQKHSNDVRARTLPNRQKDSNIFMSMLYKPQAPSASKAEKTATAPKFTSILKEEFSMAQNPVFVDIGPGLANRYFTCISSIELATALPKLNIIALDLPEQVDIFYKEGPPKIQSRVYSHPNILIMGGDGTKPMRKQLEEYPTKKRKAELPSGMDIVRDSHAYIFRAANSIDVYYKLDVLEEVLITIKNDFPDAGVLVFLNRMILYKPSGAMEYRFIGHLSPWGFNHQTADLDRRGEAPYTLFEDME